MTENIAGILTYMLIVAAFAFIIGWRCGEQLCCRRSAETEVEQMRVRLEQASSNPQTLDRQLKQIRSIPNDLHKLVLTVSKALKNPAR